MLFVYLLPVSFLIVVAKKMIQKEEIDFLDLLLAVYTDIWIVILTTIGFYVVRYFVHLKSFLGLKEEYIWILTGLAFFLLFYNIYLWWKISRAKNRRLDKW